MRDEQTLLAVCPGAVVVPQSPRIRVSVSADDDADYLWFAFSGDELRSDALARVLLAMDARQDVIALGADEAGGEPRALSVTDMKALRLSKLYDPSGQTARGARDLLLRAEFLRAHHLTPSPKDGSGELLALRALQTCMCACLVPGALVLSDTPAPRRDIGAPQAALAHLALLRAQALCEDADMASRFDLLALEEARLCAQRCFCAPDNPLPYRARRAAFLAFMRAPDIARARLSKPQCGLPAAVARAHARVRKARFFALNAAYRRHKS